MLSLKIKVVIVAVCSCILALIYLLYTVTLIISIITFNYEEEGTTDDFVGQPGKVIAEPYVITSNYGVCGCEIYVCGQCHYGIDLVSKASTPYIYVYDDGVVVQNGFDYAGAVFVIVKHHGELYTWYIHMKSGSTSHLNVGDEINKGDVIGIMGNTGYSTGPHLHFQVNVGCNSSSCSVNPISFISGS